MEQQPNKLGGFNFMKNFNRGNRDDRRNFGRPSMHPATCDECGKSCEVPFKPTGDKPVYCSDCFGKNKNPGSQRSGGRDSGRSNFRDKQMFAAVCDKCGKSCEVPFKPSGDKPIFCQECFNKNRGGNSQNVGSNKEQFVIINSKLDKILKLLPPAVKEVAEIKPNKIVAVLAEKKVEPKKAVKKKIAAGVVKSKSKKK